MAHEDGANLPGVLIVEDNAPLRQVLAVFLKKEGCRVLEVEDGPGAIDAFRREADVSLILLDWNLPGMSGDKVYDELLRIRNGFLAVVMSGSPPAEVARAFAGHRISRFVQKPFRPQTIAGMVRLLLADGEPSNTRNSDETARSADCG